MVQIVFRFVSTAEKGYLLTDVVEQIWIMKKHHPYLNFSNYRWVCLYKLVTLEDKT